MVAEVVYREVSVVASGLVSPVVAQAACAVVAEFVRGLVARMVCATDCGTTGEMVAVMVSRTKTGMLASVQGNTQGAGRVRADVCMMSNVVWHDCWRVPCRALF
jgi:hypothetical protein